MLQALNLAHPSNYNHTSFLSNVPWLFSLPILLDSSLFIPLIPSPHNCYISLYDEPRLHHDTKEGSSFCFEQRHMKMATKQASFILMDEHFIHLELSSSDLVSHRIISPPQSREFEFQTSSVSHEKESSSSLADDLFYEGKLLPLHLLNNSNAIPESVRTRSDLPDYSFPLPSSCPPSISPSESSMALGEANPYKFLSVLPSDDQFNGFAGDHPNKSLSKKLKLTKLSRLGQRLKASRAYVKSLFRKYDSPGKSCLSVSNNKAVTEKKSITPSEVVVDDTRHQLFIKTMGRELNKDGVDAHSRSFSGVIRHSVMSASSFGSLSSSSFSLSSSSRSSSANSKRESSIEGAIAHCKQSQQQCTSTKIPDYDVRICLESASKFAN